MPRPECPLDPEAGPTARFAHDLRELRRRAGLPTYREMQVKSFVSYSSLSRAAAGRKLPTWAVTKGFVQACGGDVVEWKLRWNEAAHCVGSEVADRSFGRSPRSVPFPDPGSVRTVEQLRLAVADLRQDRDLGAISTMMRAPISVAHLVCGWPEQVDLAVFLRFVRACGAPDADEERWAHAWRDALEDQRRQRNVFPAPESIHTPEQMRAAIEAMLASTSVNAVAARMQTNPGTVGRVLAGADRIDAESFGRFVAACGVSKADVDGWIDARRRVIETRDRRRLVTASTPVLVTAAPGPVTMRVLRRPEPPPAPQCLPEVYSYEDLLVAVRALRDAAGMSCVDIERISDGRLDRHAAAAILDGVLPAGGEQFVLLLRALGVRGEVDRWVDAWSRLNGSRLGRAAVPPPGEPGAAPRIWPGIVDRFLPVAALVMVLTAAGLIFWLV